MRSFFLPFALPSLKTFFLVLIPMPVKTIAAMSGDSVTSMTNPEYVK
jgi:hypothetical protein